MRPEDLVVGKVYRGPRSDVRGRFRRRRLLLIERPTGFAPEAKFTEMDRPFIGMKFDDKFEPTTKNMTLKAFARWAVSEWPE